MMQAKDLAISYRTLKELAVKNKSVLPALKAVKRAWDTLPESETEGKHIAIYKTNQGGAKTTKEYAEKRKEIIRLRSRDASLRTIADMVNCSLKYVQDVLATDEAEKKLVAEDDLFWSSMEKKETKKGTEMERAIREGQLTFFPDENV